jgi:hypothetical protein
MKLEDLLNHQLLNLPKNWRQLGYNSYYECVVNEASNYLKLISEIDDSINYGEDKYIGRLSKQHLLSAARGFFQAVIKTLQSYLNEGNPHKAYNILDKIIKEESREEACKALIFYLEFNHLYPQHYRIRAKNGKAELKDLFHVPFELRQIINSNRYSIPGYPTLYFSNSIYLAYKELGDPDYDDLYVSKFLHTRYFNNSETLLDMTNKPMWDSPEFQFKFLARWILTMACSIKVGYPNSPFKPEYVLPQIIFQWVKNNINIGHRKVIGVSYSSTKISDNKEGFYGYFYNTAIPIHSSNKEGFCDVLSKQFCLTKPISFNEALKLDKKASQQGQVKSVEMNGAHVEYVKSDFGKIEQVLSENPYSELFYVNGKKVE